LSKTENALSFVVVVPHWPDRPAWQRLTTSRYARHVVKLEVRPTRFNLEFRSTRPIDFGRYWAISDESDRFLGQLAHKTQSPLGFVVVVPHWPDRPAWQRLTTSRYARHVVKLEVEPGLLFRYQLSFDSLGF
jgi:hypothetical protein